MTCHFVPGAEVRPFAVEEKRWYQVFISKIVAAIVWSETGNKCALNDFAKWFGIKTVASRTGCSCQPERQCPLPSPSLLPPPLLSTSEMNARDSSYKILNTILREVRNLERTLVEDWDSHAWFGESKGAWWRGRVRDQSLRRHRHEAHEQDRELARWASGCKSSGGVKITGQCGWWRPPNGEMSAVRDGNSFTQLCARDMSTNVMVKRVQLQEQLAHVCSFLFVLMHA